MKALSELAKAIRSKKWWGGEVAELGEVWAARLDEIIKSATREKFEEAVFRQYFIKNVGSDLRIKPGILFKDEFCKRDENGNYTREEVSAMWFGWQLYQKEVL